MALRGILTRPEYGENENENENSETFKFIMLVRLFVCSSVPRSFLNRERKGVWKTKIGVNVTSGRSNRCANVQLRRSNVTGCGHDCAIQCIVRWTAAHYVALGRHIFTQSFKSILNSRFILQKAFGCYVYTARL